MSKAIDSHSVCASASWVKLLIRTVCVWVRMRKGLLFLPRARREQKKTADFFSELTVREKDELERDECIDYCTSSKNRSIKLWQRRCKICQWRVVNGTVLWLSARYGTRSVGFAPLAFFKMTTQIASCISSGRGNVRREIRGLQPSAANLQHSPKQKSEKLNLTNADIYVAPCVWKSWKSQRKRAGSCVITSVVVNLIKSLKRWNRTQREKCSQENAMKNPKKLRYSVCV